MVVNSFILIHWSLWGNINVSLGSDVHAVLPISGFIPSVPSYIYAVKDKDVYVNLFMSNDVTLNVGGKKVSLSQTTSYPWNGDIQLRITHNSAKDFTLKIRIPGWVRNQVVPSNLYAYTDEFDPSYRVMVNGEEVHADLQDGYFSINRQ